MSLWSRLDGCMVQAADECFFYFVFFLPSSQWKCIFYFLHSAIKKEYFPPPCSFLENARGFKKVRQTHTIVLDCKNKMKTPVHMRNLSWYYFDTCAYLTCCLTDFYSSVNIFFFHGKWDSFFVSWCLNSIQLAIALLDNICYQFIFCCNFYERFFFSK